MDAKGLRAFIEKLLNDGDYSHKLEAHPLLAINRDPWYKSQKEHWLGWLGEQNASAS